MTAADRRAHRARLRAAILRWECAVRACDLAEEEAALAELAKIAACRTSDAVLQEGA